MNPHTETPSNPRSGSRERAFVIAILVVMAIATGPGLLFVNRPETVFGFPLIYVWGILWYAVLVGIAIAMDRLIWRKDRDSEETETGEA